MVGPLAAGTARTTEHVDRVDVFVRYLDPAGARPRAARGLLGAATPGRRRATEWRDDRAAGPRALDVEPGRRHRRLDRLRRPPALGAVRRPARGRRPLADLGVGRRPDGPRRAAAACALRVSADGSRGVAVGQAVRRVPRRHLRAGHPRHASTWLPRRRPRTRRRRSYPGRSTTSTSTSTPAPTPSRRPAAAARRSPARTGRTPSRRPRRSRSPCTRLRCGSPRGPAAGSEPPAFTPGAAVLVRGRRGRDLDGQPGRTAAHHHLRGAARSAPTTCRTTAGPPRTTRAR